MKLVPLVLPILLFVGGMPAPADDPPEARFAAMSPAEVRAYERETLRRVADLALVPPVLNTEPLPQYDYDKLDYGMTIGIERTPKGRIWACWVAGGDSPKAFFVLATSDDDGETWSKPRLVVDSHAPNLPRERSILVGNLWTDPQGRLWLFFDQSMEMFDGRAGLWASVCENPDAEKPAWSPPRRIWHGVMLNKPTVLSTGEWMLPVSLDQRDGSLPTERGMFGPFQRLFPELDPLRGANVLVSADRGKTWQRRGGVRFPNPDWHEHMIVERRDKSLWMLARTKKGIMQSTSTDGGRTWAEPTEPPGIRQPNARFHVRRLASGKLLLVKHGDRIDAHEGRVKLSAWLSDDDGATWQGGLLLDERPGISYPDGFQAPDGTIFISYDRNRATDGEILLARFTEADVAARQLTGPKSKLEMLISRPLAPPKPWISNRGERLYNGIVLPEVWPPAHLGPASADPMPVPYLEHPPKVIPIDVGRQLFVDDFLVESSTLKRTFHTAKKYEGNPVFKAETELELRPAEEGERGERATTFLGQGGVFYDPAEKHFKMFYVAGWRGPLSLATSTDMIHWRRPELGLAGGNSLLPRGLRWTGPQLKTGGSDNCVWLDLNAPSPAERIKFITCWLHVPKEQRPQGFMHSLHVSDGKTWSDAVPTTIAADDYCSFFYNPFRGKWCFSIKRGTSRGRSRYYLEDADFLHGADWSQAVYWTSADNRDAAEPVGRYPGAGDAPQLYSLNAVAYESLMVGMHYIHRGPRNEICEKGNFPKLTDLELGFSRDGFHWDRPDRRGFIVGSRTEGSWDRGYLHGTAGMFVVLDDQLIFPYMGASGMAPDGYRGMYTGGAIGLAMLRRDGFASLDAGEEAGTLTTRPVVFRGSRLFVNVAAPKGALRVEALDEAGKVVATSKPVFGDSTKQAVAWVDRGDLSDLAGRPIRFRFHLTHGSFYSFWVTSDAAGASNGYVGAGGPEFAGVRDVAPRP